MTCVVEDPPDASLPTGRHQGGKTWVFLLPGVYGDEPQLNDFRVLLAGRLEFHTIDLPDLKAPLSVLSSIPETARVVVEDILHVQRDGIIYIVGFSFGASLAVEVVAQLEHAGRDIAYLGLIDAPLKAKNMRRRLSLSPTGVFAILRRLLQKLNERRHLRNATHNLMAQAEMSDPQRRSLLLDLRCTALNQWNPPGCDTVGLLFLSDLLYKRTNNQWAKLCPNCKQIRISCDHEHIIQGESSYRVAAALADDIARRVEARKARPPETSVGPSDHMMHRS